MADLSMYLTSQQSNPPVWDRDRLICLTLLDLINDYLIDPAQGYASSKAALNVIMAKFNAAYKGQSILFTSICPGEVDTTADGAQPARKLTQLPSSTR